VKGDFGSTTSLHLATAPTEWINFSLFEPKKLYFGISSPAALKEVLILSTKIPARPIPGHFPGVESLVILVQRSACLL
jgi:hypothetical protein